jgi:hypothetical protein
MADPEQPAAKRTRFDTSNGQALSSAAPIGTAPAKPVTAVDAKAVLERARAALEKKKALDAKLKASRVRAYSTLRPRIVTLMYSRLARRPTVLPLLLRFLSACSGS